MNALLRWSLALTLLALSVAWLARPMVPAPGPFPSNGKGLERTPHTHPSATPHHAAKRLAKATAISGFQRGPAGDQHLERQGLQVTVRAGQGLHLALTDTPSRSADRPTLDLRLRQLSRGAVVHYQQAANPPDHAPVTGEGQLRLRLGPGLCERYLPLRRGVELLYDLEQLPQGTGPLRFDLDLSLKGLIPHGEASGGLRLRTLDGQDCVSIGQVIARDAAGRPFVTEPRLAADGRGLSFELDEEWLARAVFPIVVDPPVLLNPQFAASADSNVGAPSVAASLDRFLVAYADFGANNAWPALRARLLGSDGATLADLELAGPNKHKILGFATRRPQTASDGSNFLVLWSEKTGGLFGSLIQPDGTLLGVGDPPQTIFQIAPTTAKLDSDLPLASFNGQNYLIAWHDRTAANKKNVATFFRLLSPSGELLTPVTRLAHLDPTRFREDQLLLFLSPGPGFTTLAVYRENSELPLQYRAQRIDASGALLDPTGISLFRGNPDQFGFGAPIGAAPDGTAGWQILSGFNQVRDSAVYRHFLDKDGRVTRADEASPSSGGIFTRMGMGVTGLAIEDEFVPAFLGAGLNLPGGGSGGEWLFVRNVPVTKKRIDLRAKRVGTDGTDYDRTPFQINTEGDAIHRSAAAVALPSAGRFLVAWLQDGSLGGGRGLSIQAALLDSAGDANATPFTEARLSVLSQGDPVIIAAGTEITFDWSASSGPIESQLLSFGNDQNEFPALGTFTATHKYLTAGVFDAVIMLKNQGYTSSASVRIFVSQGKGSLGADLAVGGTPPLTNSTGFNPDLAIRSAQLVLDLSSPNRDTLVLRGQANPKLLPDTAAGAPTTGKEAQVSLFGPSNPPGQDPDGFDEAAAGPKSYSFRLDDNGAHDGFASGAGTEHSTFQIEQRTGAFEFQVAAGSLASCLVPDLGTHKDPSQDRRIRLGLLVNGVDFGTTTAVMLYSSAAGLSGNGVYFESGTGKEDSGAWRFTSLAILETATLVPAHSATLKGTLIRPGGLDEAGGGPYQLPESGSWRFRLGEFLAPAIDVATARAAGRLTESKTRLQYRGAKGDAILLFQLDKFKGLFTLQFNPIATEGGIGLPLASGTLGSGDVSVLVDLYLGLELEFENGPFTASGFVRIQRTNAKSTSWTLARKLGAPVTTAK